MARTRSLGIAMAIVSVAFGFGYRLLFVESQEFGPSDLESYESTPYGVDLPEWYADRPFFLAWSRGDGQAYVTLGADPWAEGPARTMTPALYRYSRVGFAWLGRMAAMGQVALLPIGLLIVNGAALAGLGWIAGTRFPTWGPRSLLLVLAPGAWIAFASDTGEATALALAAVGVTSRGWSKGIASSAVLGLIRPDFATGLFARMSGGPVVFGAAAFAAAAIRVFGVAGLEMEWSGSSAEALSPPMIGYIRVLGDQGAGAAVVTLALLAWAVVTIVVGVSRERRWRRVGYVLTGGFMLVFGEKVLVDPVNALRASATLWLIWAVPGAVTRSPESEPVSERVSS